MDVIPGKNKTFSSSLGGLKDFIIGQGFVMIL